MMATSDPMPAPAPSERILLVDDEPDLRQLVTFNLREAGFEVDAVGSGQAGLALAAKIRPAVIVLDLMLPDISGMEVCRALRARSGARRRGGAHAHRARRRVRPRARLRGRRRRLRRQALQRARARDARARAARAARPSGARRGPPPAATASSAGRGSSSIRSATASSSTSAELQLRPLEFKLLPMLLEHPGRVYSRSGPARGGVGHLAATPTRAPSTPTCGGSASASASTARRSRRCTGSATGFASRDARPSAPSCSRATSAWSSRSSSCVGPRAERAPSATIWSGSSTRGSSSRRRARRSGSGRGGATPTRSPARLGAHRPRRGRASSTATATCSATRRRRPGERPPGADEPEFQARAAREVGKATRAVGGGRCTSSPCRRGDGMVLRLGAPALRDRRDGGGDAPSPVRRRRRRGRARARARLARRAPRRPAAPRDDRERAKLARGDYDVPSRDARRVRRARPHARVARGGAEGDSIGELTSERDRLSAILRGMVEGVLVFDADGRVILANPAAERMLGANRLVGRDARRGGDATRRCASVIRRPRAGRDAARPRWSRARAQSPLYVSPLGGGGARRRRR